MIVFWTLPLTINFVWSQLDLPFQSQLCGTSDAPPSHIVLLSSSLYQTFLSTLLLLIFLLRLQFFDLIIQELPFLFCYLHTPYLISPSLVSIQLFSAAHQKHTFNTFSAQCHWSHLIAIANSLSSTSSCSEVCTVLCCFVGYIQVCQLPSPFCLHSLILTSTIKHICTSGVDQSCSKITSTKYGRHF